YISEHNRFGRAGALARRNDLAVADQAIFFLGPDLGSIDSLHAVGALLHHSAAAHGDVRIAHAVQARRLVIRVEIEVEPADLVRTVVGAIPRADAAVVGHVVQALGVVRGGADRADIFARCVFALHAGQRLVIHLGIVQVPAEIGVNANPVHGATARHLIFAHDGDVVLRLAGNHARVAADTPVQVNRHAPGIAAVLVAGVDRGPLGIFIVRILGEAGILAEFLHCGDADQIASVL